MRRNWLTYLPPLFSAALFVVAVWVLKNQLTGSRFHDLAAEIRSTPLADLVTALAVSALSYFVIGLYDAFGLRLAGHGQPLHRTVFVSFIAEAFSHSLGFPLVTGTGTRYRLYGQWGLNALDIATITAFAGGAIAAGGALLIGVSGLTEPAALASRLPLSAAAITAIATAALLAAALYVGFAGIVGERLRLARVGILLPRPLIAGGQAALGLLDWTLAAAVLWILLPAGARPHFLAFVPIFSVAVASGLLSNIPGGLGVFETIIIAALPTGSSAAVLAALVLYRGIYYVLPLLIAAAALAATEVLARAGLFRRRGEQLARVWLAIAPSVFAVLVFVAGAILLVSTALPIASTRLAFLQRILPLGVVELSHFAASLIGMALLLTASALRRRLDTAYFMTLGLLLAGAVAAILKGLGVAEATLLTGLFAILLTARRAFYRRTRLTTATPDVRWLVAAGMAVIAMLGAGWFAYAHTEFRQDLLLRFDFIEDAPRFLRAAAGAVAMLAVAGFWFLMGAGRPPRVVATPEDIARARTIVRGSSTTLAYLALARDKTLLLSESGQSFIMYAVQGRSWIALGDPVGLKEERQELLWRFRDLCDRFNGWPIFAPVPPESLSLYLEIGLTFQKLGEQAYVPLAQFTLRGERMKSLRQRHHRMAERGLSLAILDPDTAAPNMDTLRRISDAWLQAKERKELTFAVGRFDPDYLREFPIAVVTQAGEMRAFASLLATADKNELSIDLMRYHPDLGRDVMDYLFAELMIYGQREGYRRFELGLAPLAGLEGTPFSSPWSRAGALIYRHGEHFYNFQGLRQYKAKFNPVWEPRYVASPGGLTLARAAANAARLIAGGAREPTT